MKLENKKANIGLLIGLLIFIGIIIAFAFLGIVAIAGGNIIIGETADILRDVGMVGEVNFTEAADLSIGTVDTLLNQAKWMSGIILIIMLMGIIMFSMAVRFNPNPMWIGGFFILAILLILFSVTMSNAYEDFYNANDEIGAELRSMTMTSWIMINLPNILLILSFIGGIIMFSGIRSQEAFV